MKGVGPIGVVRSASALSPVGSTGIYMPDAQPLIADPASVEFAGIADGGATGMSRFDPGGALAGGTLEVNAGLLRIETAAGGVAANKLVYEYVPAPAAEFAVYTTTQVFAPFQNYRISGLGLGNAGIATNTAPRVFAIDQSDVNALQPVLGVRTYDATGIVGTTVAPGTSPGIVSYDIRLRMLVNGAVATCWYSMDGGYWNQLGVAALAVGFAPAFVGLPFLTSTAGKIIASSRYLRFFTGPGSSVPGANNLGRLT